MRSIQLDLSYERGPDHPVRCIAVGFVFDFCRPRRLARALATYRTAKPHSGILVMLSYMHLVALATLAPGTQTLPFLLPLTIGCPCILAQQQCRCRPRLKRRVLASNA